MKKKIIIAVIVVIIIIAVAVGYIFSRDIIQERILTQEINTLSELDIAEDDYNTPIKSSGDYAVVERTIKTYLNDYSTELKKVLKILEDEQLVKTLTVENYEEDGPEFEKTKKYISETKTQFNESMNIIKEKCSKEAIMEEIQGKNLEQKYIDLYEKLMLTEELESELETQKAELEESSEQINNLLDVYEKVINFLYENKGSWEVNGNMIQFETNKLVEQYNKLTDELK